MLFEIWYSIPKVEEIGGVWWCGSAATSSPIILPPSNTRGRWASEVAGEFESREVGS